MLHINSLELKELGDVIDDGEGDDGEDVPETMQHTSLAKKLNKKATNAQFSPNSW